MRIITYIHVCFIIIYIIETDAIMIKEYFIIYFYYFYIYFLIIVLYFLINKSKKVKETIKYSIYNYKSNYGM